MKKVLSALALSITALGLSAPITADEVDTGARQVTMERLRANAGITLQWIGWESRGQVEVRQQGGTTYLTGSQIDPNGPGSLWIDGEVIDAGADYFIFEGTIRMANTPDVGRICQETKRWHFAITQNRKYYRLREFEWCDGLTDYIDIYF